MKGFYERARALMGRGKYNEAIALLRKVLVLERLNISMLKPFLAEARLLIGYCYGEMRRWDEALKEIQRAIELDPESAVAYCALGFAYGKMGKFHKAVEAFQKALEKDPKCGLAHRGLALWRARMGEVEEAVRELEEALKVEPQYSATYAQLASAYERKGDYERALAFMEKAVKLSPKNPRYRISLAMLYHELGRLDEAAREAEAAFRLKPERDAGRYAIRLYHERRNFDRLIPLAKEFLRHFPDDTDVLVTLSQALQEQGKLSEAIRYAERAVEVCPLDEHIRMYLASLYEQDGDIAAAVEHYQQILSQSRNHRAALAAAEALHMLDRLQLEEIFRLAASDPEFRERLREDPQSALEERGFSVSPQTLSSLQATNWDDPSTWPAIPPQKTH